MVNKAFSGIVFRLSDVLNLLDLLDAALEGVVSLDGVLALPSLLTLTSLSSEIVSKASAWLFLVERRVGVASAGSMFGVLTVLGSCLRKGEIFLPSAALSGVSCSFWDTVFISSSDSDVLLVLLLGVTRGEPGLPFNLVRGVGTCRSFLPDLVTLSSVSSRAGVVDRVVLLGVLGAEEVEAPLSLRLLLRGVVDGSLEGE